MESWEWYGWVWALPPPAILWSKCLRMIVDLQTNGQPFLVFGLDRFFSMDATFCVELLLQALLLAAKIHNET